MKQLFKTFFITCSLLIAGCDKPEDIIPAGPSGSQPSSGSPISPAGDTTKNHIDTSIQDSALLDSAFYSFERFQDLPYRILLPRKYDSTASYPLVLFLHGIGESGTDNKRQLTWGGSLFQQDSIRRNYPAVVVFPQCPVGRYWFNPWGLQRLSGLVDHVQSSYKIDSTRLYIIGLSMGAYGTYSLTAYRPGLFAAAIAISGDGDRKKASLMAQSKWWVFAGKKDIIVRASKSENMVKALKQAKAQVRFTLYENADHAYSWIFALQEPDFCKWLFANKK